MLNIAAYHNMTYTHPYFMLCIPLLRFFFFRPSIHSHGNVPHSGDFTNGDGTGGEPALPAVRNDENFIMKHTKAGLLSMANCK